MDRQLLSRLLFRRSYDSIAAVITPEISKKKPAYKVIALLVSTVLIFQAQSAALSPYVPSHIQSEYSDVSRDAASTLLKDEFSRKKLVFYAPAHLLTTGVTTYLDNLLERLAVECPGIQIHVVAINMPKPREYSQITQFPNGSSIAIHVTDTRTEYDSRNKGQIAAILNSIQSQGKIDLIVSEAPFHAVSGGYFNVFGHENNIPVIQKYHGGPWALLDQDSPLSKDLVKQGVFSPGTIQILKAADVQCTVSKTIAKDFEKAYDIPEMNVLPPIVNLDEFSPAGLQKDQLEQLRVSKGLQGKFVLLLAGRPASGKGYETLLSAVDKLSESRKQQIAVVFAGFNEDRLRGQADGYSNKIGEQVDELRKNGVKIEFAGELSRTVLRLWYAAADVCVVPSNTRPQAGGVETFGLVSVEAQSMGTPVIVSRSGALPENVVDGETGMIVDPYSVSEFMNAIEALMNKDIRDRLGEAAARFIKNKFDKEKLLLDHLTFYKKAIQTPVLHQEVMAKIEAVSTILKKERALGYGKLDGAETIEDLVSLKSISYDRGVVYIPRERGQLIVIGDLHGDIKTLRRILYEQDILRRLNEGENIKVLFLGDYQHRLIDTGIDLSIFIMDLKLRYPDHVIFLAGNNDKDIYYEKDFPEQFERTRSYCLNNRVSPKGGFFSECLNAFSEKHAREVYFAFGEMFRLLPSLALCGNRVIGAHAGPVSYGDKFQYRRHPSLSAIVGHEGYGDIMHNFSHNFVNKDMTQYKRELWKFLEINPGSPWSDRGDDNKYQVYHKDYNEAYTIGMQRVDEMIDALKGSVFVRGHDHLGDTRTPWIQGEMMTIISCEHNDTVPRYAVFDLMDSSKHEIHKVSGDNQHVRHDHNDIVSITNEYMFNILQAA